MHDSINRSVTLREACDFHINAGTLKPKSQLNYRQRMTYLSDWFDLDLTEITEKMVIERYREIKSKSMASAVMRTLRAVMLASSDRNPVRGLSRLHLWHTDGKVQPPTFIKVEQLSAWMKAVYSIQNSTVRDLLLLILFTGIRSGNARELSWSQVDLCAGIIMLEPYGLSKTKIKELNFIPLNSFAWNLLKVRRFGARGELVFPGPYDATKPIGPSCKTYLQIGPRSGVKFSYDSLRNTFANVGDSLDIKSEVIRELMNCTSPKDLFERRISRSVERLRRASQKICDAIIEHSQANIYTAVAGVITDEEAAAPWTSLAR